jgi:beta-N-acetylhexosaminidase
MLDLRGQALSPEEKERLRHPATGGVILFSRNYASPDQVADLVSSIRALRSGLLIAVDHEGGRVQRFRDGFTKLPPAAAYAKGFRGASDASLDWTENGGWLMAMELRAMDIDFSFAPVLDVDCGVSEIIGDRAFSRDAATVAQLASAFARGMRRAGMAAVGKHFPGHGGVALDSHLSLPVDRRSLAELVQKDLLPFRALIKEGLEGIMPAHIVYPEVDDQPAGFSAYWIRDVLRAQMGFAGVVFSDDLSMAAAECAGDYGGRARRALAAGCDMILVCNNPDAQDRVLDASLSAVDAASQSRLIAMRGGFTVDRQTLLASREWRVVSERFRSIIDEGECT